jgi:seryl-tRNA synthetase
MLDIKFIRENSESVKKGIAKKGVDPKLVDSFLRLDEEWRDKTAAIDQLRAEHNLNTAELAKRRTDDLLGRAEIFKKQLSVLEEEKKKIEQRRQGKLNLMPNLPFEDVPLGKNEKENKVIREVGKKPILDFPPKNYLEIAEKLDLIDIKRAAKVSGTRFGFLKNQAALLEFALVKLAFDELVKNGFVPVVPPVMIKPKVFEGMGRLAGDQKEERYYLPKDDLYLVGSAEHTLGPLHMDEVLDEKDLPRRYVAFSTCFRREAGSYGKDTKGILRVHQFDKVEMFCFVKPEDSEKEHQFLLSRQENLMQAIKLPYRVMEICTGEMGWTDARQYDIETWLPSENRYRESHSCSNTTDFQARGINAKYRDRKTGETKFVHMLNATAFAIGRTLIAIIENYQTKEGNFDIPKVLTPFLRA